MNEEIENRFVSLETKMAYMEDFLNQIQQVAVEQAKTIEILRKENKIISQRLREISELV